MVCNIRSIKSYEPKSNQYHTTGWKCQNTRKGISAMDVAMGISEGLARNVLAAEVNGEVWDAGRPIHTDVSLKLLTWNDEAGKSTFWHSSAHLMAEALEALYPGIKLGIGPSIENGYYYDVDFGDRGFDAAELESIEKNA